MTHTYIKGADESVVFGPGDISLAHTEDERRAIEDLMKTVEVYSELIVIFREVPKEP